jgi:AmpE protein
MELLAILIVLGLLQLWGSGKPIQKDGWFGEVADFFEGAISGTELRVILSIFTPLVLLAIVQGVIDDALFGLLSLCLYVLVLLYSLGRGDFSETLQGYLAKWNAGNFESAFLSAKQIGDFARLDDVESHQSLHARVRQQVFYQGYERWFAPVFWFLLLGPVGALLYRLTFIAARSKAFSEEEQGFALKSVYYLDYVPVRLLAFAFNLTGNFHHGFNAWLDELMSSQPAAQVLDNTGMASLTGVDEVRPELESEQDMIHQGRLELQSIQGLLSRSVVCWLIVIALLEVVA